MIKNYWLKFRQYASYDNESAISLDEKDQDVVISDIPKIVATCYASRYLFQYFFKLYSNLILILLKENQDTIFSMLIF